MCDKALIDVGICLVAAGRFMVPNSTAALRKKVRLHSVLHQEQLIIRKVSFVFKSKSDANNSVCRQTHSPIALHVFIFTFRYHKSSRYIMFSYMGRCLYKALCGMQLYHQTNKKENEAPAQKCLPKNDNTDKRTITF